ncbi:MAG: carotenoid oxygenase family protein [Stanieria sp.]
MTFNDKSWSKAFSQPAQEFALTALPILSGSIPVGLRGTLYRNGPGRLQRGKHRVGHWFDGDGAILAVNFTATGATGVYRYVQTQGYQKEEVANTFVYPNYGMTAAGGFWKNWLKPVKNAANTSVLALPDRLLALWEGGLPHALDLQTLATRGIDNLASLSKNQAFSAHPKVDGQTGEIFNFGVAVGSKTILNLYCCNAEGKVKQQNCVELKGLPLIHDFVLAGEYLVFFIPPVRVNVLPVLLGLKSFSEAMVWQPKLGTEILIFDRNNLDLVSRLEAEAWYQWHFTNGFVDDNGLITIEFVRYSDFQTNQYLKEVATGKTKTAAKGTLWEIKIDPKTKQVIASTQLLDRGCEFPVVPQHLVGKSWDQTYLSIYQEGTDLSQELLNAIACYDRQTGELSIADVGSNSYPSEPIYVPQPDNLAQGWLITVVYNGNDHHSEVRIYESDRLESEPVCRLGLPNVIPPSFHGTWKSSTP